MMPWMWLTKLGSFKVGSDYISCVFDHCSRGGHFHYDFHYEFSCERCNVVVVLLEIVWYSAVSLPVELSKVLAFFLKYGIHLVICSFTFLLKVIDSQFFDSLFSHSLITNYLFN